MNFAFCKIVLSKQFSLYICTLLLWSEWNQLLKDENTPVKTLYLDLNKVQFHSYIRVSFVNSQYEGINLQKNSWRVWFYRGQSSGFNYRIAKV